MPEAACHLDGASVHYERRRPETTALYRVVQQHAETFLSRYVARPALSNERVKYDEGAGRVTIELKTPWRDGTTHIVMTPLEFMQRLAALVPRPRLHLIRFHGVLAPNAKLRPQVVPMGPPAPRQAVEGDEDEEPETQRRPNYIR